MSSAAEKKTKAEKQLCFRISKDGGVSEFYTVDLKRGTLSPILERLENDRSLGYTVLVALDSFIYSVGFFPNGIYRNFGPPPVEYVKALFLDLRSPSLGWIESPNIIFRHPISNPVIYRNMIYALILTRTRDIKAKLIYDPKSDAPLQVLPIPNWPETYLFPSKPIISDPCSNRILMHFRSCGLYAYHPEDENQPVHCVDPNMFAWSDRTVLADGVLYFHHSTPTPIIAYDLETRKWLEVKWTSPCGADIDREWSYWRYFFHLGNGNLCLAKHINLYETVYTCPFKVEKDPSGQGILATPGIPNQYKFQGG